MVENLRVDSGSVDWIFDNKEIKLGIEDAFYASENKEIKLVKIDSGKNFIENKVYYYNFDGDLELAYDLELGIIEWVFQGEKKQLFIKNIKQVGFFPQEQRLFVICGFSNQELLGYTIEGNSIFKVDSPPEFRMMYFIKIKDEIAIVCDGNKKHEDKYGRYRYNFVIDINTGQLRKGSLAY